MDNQKFFCPNCGKPISKNDIFCPECGFNVKKYLAGLQAKSTNHPNNDSQRPTQSAPTQPSPSAEPTASPEQPHRRTPRQAMKPWQVISVVVVFIILIGGYLFLNHYYGKTATADRLVTAIKQDEGKTVASLVKSNDPSFKITSSSVEPLITYYSQNKDQLAKLKGQLTSTGYVNDHLAFVNSGHKFLLFNNYQLKVKTIYPEIQTNRAGAKLKVNGKVLSNKIGTTNPKKIGPYMPGEYTVQTSDTVNGHKLVNNGKYAWIDPTSDDEDISLNLQTISYTIKGQAGSTVFLSGKKIGTLNKSGFYDIKEYPFSQDMTVQLSMKTASGKVVNSDKTKIDMSMDGSTVTPVFSGFASTDDASDLINNIWGDISDGTVTDADSANDDDFDDYFTGGSTSIIYQDLLKMVDSYQKNDHIDDYEMEPTIKKVVPYDTGQTMVIYDIKYTFDNGNHDHIQVFEYEAIIQKSGDNYKMKTNRLTNKVSDYDKD